MNIQILRTLSVAYLLIPNIIFFFYWTRLSVSIAGILILMYIFFFDQVRDRSIKSDCIFERNDLVYISFVAVILTLLSGIAGLCWQTFDYQGHNIKFYELFLHGWPLRSFQKGPVLSYYFGFYCLPALYSKSVGHLSEKVIFLWTFTGLFLGVAWLYIVLNKKMLLVLLCLGLGDTPTVIKMFLKTFGVPLQNDLTFGVSIISIRESLQFAPNQVIPALIIGGLLVFILKNKLEVENIVFPTTLCYWWAIFPAFSISIFVGVLIFRKWILNGFKLNRYVVINKIVLPVLTSIPVLLLFKSHNQVPVSGFIWNFGASEDIANEYILNIGINILIFVIVFNMVRKRAEGLSYFPFYLSLLLIVLFALFRIGKENDFLFRGTIPYLLIAGLYVLIPFSIEKPYLSMFQVARKSLFHFVCMFLLIISFYTSIRRVTKALMVNSLTASIFPESVYFLPYAYDEFSSINEFLLTTFGPEGANQYMGRTDSIYELYITDRSQIDNFPDKQVLVE